MGRGYVNQQIILDSRTCEVVEKFLADFSTAPQATRLNMMSGLDYKERAPGKDCN